MGFFIYSNVLVRSIVMERLFFIKSGNFILSFKTTGHIIGGRLLC